MLCKEKKKATIETSPSLFTLLRIDRRTERKNREMGEGRRKERDRLKFLDAFFYKISLNVIETIHKMNSKYNQPRSDVDDRGRKKKRATDLKEGREKISDAY